MAKWHYEAKWSILNGVLTISENSHIVRVTIACCDHGCTEFHLGNIGSYVRPLRPCSIPLRTRRSRAFKLPLCRTVMGLGLTYVVPVGIVHVHLSVGVIQDVEVCPVPGDTLGDDVIAAEVEIAV